ncbi:MAG: hypothetical protein WC504_14200, partial [Methylobacter sp.]
LKDISSAGVKHLLEGSVQIDEERLRASIRLVDVSAGCIAWTEQFDRRVFFAISHQEELASSICRALKRFFLSPVTAPRGRCISKSRSHAASSLIKPFTP